METPDDLDVQLDRLVALTEQLAELAENIAKTYAQRRMHERDAEFTP